MYDASVTIFTRMLTNLFGILDKAEAHVEAKKIEAAALLTARLYPDMYPLTRQVQEATKYVHWTCALLAGQEMPNHPNTETTFKELKQRITKALEFARSFKPEQINGSEERNLAIKFPSRTLEMKGQPFLLNMVLPNFYFHVTTAYAILRHNGVELIKRDFQGQV
jgi:hypothetical protein